MLSSSFAIDDPLRRSTLASAQMANAKLGLPNHTPELTTAQQTKEFFKETGRGMYRSGKGFGKVGAIYAGIECCIEGVSFSYFIVSQRDAKVGVLSSARRQTRN